MFLKTQEDLHKLLREYPLKEYHIQLKEGEYLWPFKHEIINLNNKFSIESRDEKILLIDNEFDSSLWNPKDGFSFEEYESQSRYLYDNHGIQVVSIKKKIGNGRTPLPIMINGKFIQSQFVDKFDTEHKKFYSNIEILSIHINFIRDQHLRYGKITHITNDHTSSEDDLYYIIAYWKNTSSTHSAVLYRALLDKNEQTLSITNIIKQGEKLGFLLTKEDREKLTVFQKDKICNYVNNYLAHLNIEKFLSEDDKSIRITESTSGGTEINIPIIEPRPVIEKLGELLEFVEYIFLEYYDYSIYQGGRDYRGNMKLTLSSNN